MDPTIALLAGFGATAVVAVVARYVIRPRTTAQTRAVSPGGAAWLQTHQRCAAIYSEFAEPADATAHVLEMWPVLPAEVRLRQRKAAYEHLQTLEQRQRTVIPEGGPDVAAAAQRLVKECTRLVHDLDLNAPRGPVDVPRHLTAQFLVAGRKYLEAESERHFGLRRTAGRSLFARLSAR
ncbi:hypothetical protein [Streptomyces cadmiisoli]|uniref:hypothetical protein n=1 Tax=Streptomyces cadmiisoli TaxID=2184053 RepID=UPI003660BC7B